MTIVTIFDPPFECKNREACELTKDCIEFEDKCAGFAIGDEVEKYTGDYHLFGIIVSIFKTTTGKVRYVVEHDPGFLHIYNKNQLCRIPKKLGLDKNDHS